MRKLLASLTIALASVATLADAAGAQEAPTSRIPRIPAAERQQDGRTRVPVVAYETDGNKPVAGALVTVRSVAAAPNQPPAGQGRTSASGTWTAVVPDGTYLVEVVPPAGYDRRDDSDSTLGSAGCADPLLCVRVTVDQGRLTLPGLLPVRDPRLPLGQQPGVTGGVGTGPDGRELDLVRPHYVWFRLDRVATAPPPQVQPPRTAQRVGGAQPAPALQISVQPGVLDVETGNGVPGAVVVGSLEGDASYQASFVMPASGFSGTHALPRLGTYTYRVILPAGWQLDGAAVRTFTVTSDRTSHPAVFGARRVRQTQVPGPAVTPGSAPDATPQPPTTPSTPPAPAPEKDSCPAPESGTSQTGGLSPLEQRHLQGGCGTAAAALGGGPSGRIYYRIGHDPIEVIETAPESPAPGAPSSSGVDMPAMDQAKKEQQPGIESRTEGEDDDGRPEPPMAQPDEVVVTPFGSYGVIHPVDGDEPLPETVLPDEAEFLPDGTILVPAPSVILDPDPADGPTPPAEDGESDSVLDEIDEVLVPA